MRTRLVYAWPPGAGQPTLLARSSLVKDLFAAGGNVAFYGPQGPALIGLGGGRVRRIEPPGTGASRAASPE